MNEFFNFHDGWFVVQQNWVWLLVALALGIWVGWKSNTADGQDR
jgi:hypothetical protein